MADANTTVEANVSTSADASTQAGDGAAAFQARDGERCDAAGGYSEGCAQGPSWVRAMSVLYRVLSVTLCSYHWANG